MYKVNGNSIAKLSLVQRTNISDDIINHKKVGISDYYKGPTMWQTVCCNNGLLNGKWGNVMINPNPYYYNDNGTKKNIPIADINYCTTPPIRDNKYMGSGYVFIRYYPKNGHLFSPDKSRGSTVTIWREDDDIICEDMYEQVYAQSTKSPVIFLDLVGGGGGGGYFSDNFKASGGGGGGGGFASIAIDMTNITKTNKITVTIGLGGSAGNYSDGSAGGDTVLKVGGTTILTCHGGAGGGGAGQQSGKSIFYGISGNGGTVVEVSNSYIIDRQILYGKAGGRGGHASYKIAATMGDGFRQGKWSDNIEYNDTLTSFGILKKNTKIGAAEGAAPNQVECIGAVRPFHKHIEDWYDTFYDAGGSGGASAVSTAILHSYTGLPETNSWGDGAGGYGGGWYNGNEDYPSDGHEGFCILYAEDDWNGTDYDYR